jgi:hypothetical protein
MRRRLFILHSKGKGYRRKRTRRRVVVIKGKLKARMKRA